MKKLLRNFYWDLFLNARLFIGLTGCVVLFLLSFFFPWLGEVPYLAFLGLVTLLLLDLGLLYRTDGIFARRSAPERLSNGDENEIGLYVENRYPFPVFAGMIDEIPVQFQKRDAWFSTRLTSRQHKMITYLLRPVKRGEYEFGDVHVYVRSPLSLVSRRYRFSQAQMVPVYPSFIQMRKYELMAISNRLTDVGIKKVRRVGNSMEFEQIRTYVPGDDYRTLNWKASARTGEWMVNSYIDERAQQLCCIIDKSRGMKMPFNGLSLLDYAINATLVLANVALAKEDKAGLITAAEKIGSVVVPDRRQGQIGRILEALYREKTQYLETDMEAVYACVRHTLRQRSLVVFFTNFESLSSLERQLPYFRRIAKFHLLLVVFFENTELRVLADEPAADVEGIYIKTIAEKLAYEKRMMVKELARYGIQSVLCAPEELTVTTVNRYLDMKARHLI